MRLKYPKALLFAVLITPALIASSPAMPVFQDPSYTLDSKLIYNIEEQGNKFEHHISVDQLGASEGNAYSILSYSHLGTSESASSQSIYSRTPFLPISYVESYNNKADNSHYYKAIYWDWKAKQYNFTEIFQNGGKDKSNRLNGSWQDNPYYDISLIYTGLLNGLPVDQNSRQTKLKLFVDQFGVDINFCVISTEAIRTAGKDWFCYKIEATPDLGPLLNWVKIFWGHPKSYFWLTTTKPKLIIRAHVKTPWYERKVELKNVENQPFLRAKTSE